jgi:hypothetical protein
MTVIRSVSGETTMSARREPAVEQLERQPRTLSRIANRGLEDQLYRPVKAPRHGGLTGLPDRQLAPALFCRSMNCQDALRARVAPIARSPKRSRQRFDERPKRGIGSHDVAEIAGSPAARPHFRLADRSRSHIRRPLIL